MSWEQLLAIDEVNRQELLSALNTPPVDCPICGGPLDEARNLLHCPMGHWEGPVGAPA